MSERLPHLDGLRAVSILLVFAFHAEVLGLTGGFLGVSVFFTLSGYLLTYRLLQVEPSWTSVRRYWRARWRRILPAATVVVILVVAYEVARSLERVAHAASGSRSWA
jgi:peptidoglycan/LPS O-acetylase OafA/YrhL